MPTYYTVGDLAKTFGIPISTLRFYDKHGIFVPEYRNPENGYRYYSAEQLITLDVILFLRELDVPTGKIPEIMVHARSRADLISALREHRKEVAERIEQLIAVRDKLGYVEKIAMEFDYTTGVITRIELPERRLWCKDARNLPSGGAERRFIYKQIVGTSPARQEIPVELVSMGAMASAPAFRKTGEIVYTLQFNELRVDARVDGCRLMVLDPGPYAAIRFTNIRERRHEAYACLLGYLDEQDLKADDQLIETYVGVGMPPVTESEEIIELQARLYLR